MKRQSNRSQKRSMRTFLCRAIIPFVVFMWFVMYATSTSSSLRGPESTSSTSSSPTNLPRPSSPFSFLSSSTGDNLDTLEQIQSVVKAAEIRRIELMNHLIVVAGHSVMRLNKMRDADYDEMSWYLLPYQVGQDFELFLPLSKVELVRNDFSSLLIFSSGQTRRDVGPTSEAASYYYLADQKEWLHDIKHRVYLEEYARDSFENLLFSMCRFREIVGSYPKRVTVVGFDFKLRRFTDLHRKAIGFPQHSFFYIGMKPEGNSFDHSRAMGGEDNVIKSFENDMYGCESKELIEKKEKRNPFRRSTPYISSCPEIVELLKWCGPGPYISKNLPWYGDGQILGNDWNKIRKYDGKKKKGGYVTSEERMNMIIEPKK